MHPYNALSPGYSKEQLFHQMCESAQIANLLLTQNSQLLKRVLAIASPAASSIAHIFESMAWIRERWEQGDRSGFEDVECYFSLKMTILAARSAGLICAKASLEIRELIGNQNSPVKKYFFEKPLLMSSMISFEDHLNRLHRKVNAIVQSNPHEEKLVVIEKKILSMCNAARLNIDIAERAVQAVENLLAEIVRFLRLIKYLP